jgi:hypothetical protein
MVKIEISKRPAAAVTEDLNRKEGDTVGSR